MALTSFELDARPGGLRVVVDDVDVTDQLEAAELGANRLDTPRLTLYLRPEGKVVGEGIVEVVGAGGGDAVRGLDPGEFRARATAAMQSMADDPYTIELEVIATMLDEQAAQR